METKEEGPKSSDIDAMWPVHILLDIISFKPRVRGRVEQYLNDKEIVKLSWRQFLDLFLPLGLPPEDANFWSFAPILRQSQFGPYLYDSALLTLTEAEISPMFRLDWASRIYIWKLYELRNSPANKPVERNRATKPGFRSMCLSYVPDQGKSL